MEISSLIPESSSVAQPATGQQELDRTAFLSLLLTQLSNQDPLEPMKDEDFIAQLAQFSSLERLEEISSSMNRLIHLVETGQNDSQVSGNNTNDTNSAGG